MFGKLRSALAWVTGRRAPGQRLWRNPVGWLLDRQLLAAIKEIVVSTAFARRIDSRSWMTGTRASFGAGEAAGDEFWFDYLSDTGDGSRSTYSIAYLVQSDLWLPPNAGVGSEVACARNDTASPLPRGAFLFVGGDTAYHMSDFETLCERFQGPFNWAAEDLTAAGRAPDRRPIFAIPGNHDYYDFLDGFNRQFRRPFDDATSYLQLKGFERVQESSFVAIELPFGWQLWGWDSQDGTLDKRQKNFFVEQNKRLPADRLIVATPQPVTAFGLYRKADHAITRTHRELGLETCFLEGESHQAAPGRCRLDLAGDVHHYARYWGATSEQAPSSYASVVSGLGGAFVHSSSTDRGEVPAQARYPEPGQALRQSLRNLLSPWRIVRGGYVWLAGAFAAAVTFVGGFLAESTRGYVAEGLATIGLTFERHLSGSMKAIETTLGIHRGEKLTIDSGSVSQLWALAWVLPFVVFGWWWSGRLERTEREKGCRPIWWHRLPIALAIGGGILAAHGIFGRTSTGYGRLPPLVSNAVVAAMSIATVAAIVWTRRYDNALARRARQCRLNAVDTAFLMSLVAFCALLGALGVLRYGVDSLAVVALDVAFLAAVLGLPLGLAFFGWLGGEILPLARRAGMAAIGLCHGLVQLTLPALLAITRPWPDLLALLATVVAITWASGRAAGAIAGESAAAKNRVAVGVGLLIAWTLLVAAVLGVALHEPRIQPIDSAAFGLSILLGAALSCVWFGWYLATSLCFDAHNNEAGGGSRIGRFKQFIRFRVTRESLTGYVIAIDDPEEHGARLKPRLVDRFELRPQE